MRVMCTVSAWPTHYFPLVPMCWALQSAGHDVHVLCAPSQSKTVSRAGLTPVPVLGELEIPFLARLRNVWDAQAGRWPYSWMPPHPVTGEPMKKLTDFGFGEFARASREKMADPVERSGAAAVEYARSWRPDLVLFEPLALEGLLAARVIGVPAVLHLWGPVGTHETDPEVRGVAEYPTNSFARYGVGEISLSTVDYVLDPCPIDLQPPVDATRLPIRYLPYNGPGGQPTWALEEPERPRVSIVWGNSLTAMLGPESFAVPLVVEALADLPVEIVAMAGNRDVASVRGGDKVRVLEQFPLHLLLPTCSAVVHHGGAGCMMTAIAAGVPQLAIPAAMDQPTNAARLVASGAGLRIPRPVANPENVRAAVLELLESGEYRDDAARLRAQLMDRPTPAQVVADLEKIAG